MEASCSDHHLYPLTSLQIGDVKTNLSQAFLYFASDSKKFLILVDNQSWRKIKHSKSTHIKAFVVTTYRTSPFRNTRPLQRSSSFSLVSSNFGLKSFFKWFPNIVGKSLHGFIVFEVLWKNVRGISYLNELQTDATIAFEVKSSTKWEFSGIDQALSSMPSWFSGTRTETQRLRTNLKHLGGKVPSQSPKRNNASSNNDHRVVDETEFEFFDAYETLGLEEEPVVAERNKESESDIEPIRYEDILLLCRFENRDLPFELKPIITSDLRLLTLLESGLPSWVIFLQSYPIFCALYRPWMRPVFRTLCVLVSLVTVIIGFYDLYKNVPLLKATVSHLCGPLFKWIESWDMVSRIRYLGTMLFLQNLEKAVKAFLTMARWLKLLFSVVKETMTYPFEIVARFLMPVWNLFSYTADLLSDTQAVVVDFVRAVVDNLDDFLIAPFEFVYSYLSSLGSLVYPILSSFWELLLFATHGILVLANHLSSLLCEVYEGLENCFGFAIKTISQLLDLFKGNPDSSDFSYWHSLWKDLFSKVFRSLRSVIRILYAFVASLKRHRLSIINYVRTFLRNLRNQPVCFSSTKCSCCQGPQSGDGIKVGGRECEHCKKVS